MIISIDVPDDAARELDDALHLMATYAAAREGMEVTRNRPVLARRWNRIRRELKHAADSIYVPEDQENGVFA